jgi:hypothetical protein
MVREFDPRGLSSLVLGLWARPGAYPRTEHLGIRDHGVLMKSTIAVNSVSHFFKCVALKFVKGPVG